MDRIKIFLFVTIVVLVLIVNPNQSSAMDKNFYVGIDRGMNYSDQNFAPSSFKFDKPTYNPEWGFVFGYTAGKSGLEAGLYYTHSGAKSEDYVGTSETGIRLGDFWMRQDVTVLELPVHLSYYFNKGTFKPYLFAGPNIRYILEAENQLEADNDSEDWDTNFKSQLNLWQLSLQVGLGVKYAVSSHFDVGISASALLGITDMAKDSHDEKKEWGDIKALGGICYNF